MNPFFERDLRLTRRQFFGKSAQGIGVAALAALLSRDGLAAQLLQHAKPQHGNLGPLPGLPHFPPKAKRVIVLWQGGAPSQVDLFDYKPGLFKHRLEELPASIRAGTRLSTMTASQSRYPILPAIKPFRQYGESGMWLSEMLPHTGSIADDICLVRSMHTDAVNHAPGVTFFLTGSQIPGRPSMGAWATYGLGSMTDELPAFVVMTSADEKKTCGQLFYDYYWGSGFIPSKYQGVRFRSEGEPVLLLFLSAGCPHNAHGIEDFNRLQKMLDGKVKVAGMVNLNLRQTKALSRLDKANFPILSDQMAGVIGKFGGQAGLDNALVLPNGEVTHLWHGYDQTTLTQVETLLKRNHSPNLNLDLSKFPKTRQSGCAIGMNM
jgi:hypothetical protein